MKYAPGSRHLMLTGIKTGAAAIRLGPLNVINELFVSRFFIGLTMPYASDCLTFPAVSCFRLLYTSSRRTLPAALCFQPPYAFLQDHVPLHDVEASPVVRAADLFCQ